MDESKEAARVTPAPKSTPPSGEAVDLAIVGGGCAGLSLAARLARGGHAGAVRVIEPRARYVDDRSWCFWSRADHRLASRRWRSWRFSTAGGERLTHHGDRWRYHYVRAGDFYADAEAALAGSDAVSLMRGVTLQSMAPAPGGVRLDTSAGPITARRVVDTRAPRGRVRARLHQCFIGAEIEARGAFDPDRVGLMEDMRLGPHGFEFTYTVPVSADRALVEHTVFSPRPVAPQSLTPDLDAKLDRAGLSRARELRREGAILPMGRLDRTPAAPAGVVRAGAAAGAMRPATGYAFRRIEAWADACADQLLAGGPPLAETGRSHAAGWFDSVFLRALSRDGAPAPDWFFALARGLGADGFAHFMSDAARARDYGAVIASLPTAPFLAAALRAA